MTESVARAHLWPGLFYWRRCELGSQVVSLSLLNGAVDVL